MLQKEDMYYGEKDVTYLIQEAEKSDYLLVVFSGYSNHKTIKASYHYIKTLQNIKCNKMFILDNYGYDGRGCWYLGENGLFNFETSVYQLIEVTRKRLNISKDKVILAGSSKGGFASLYLGIKYNYKNIIAAGPQVKLGEYLRNKGEILKSITGNIDEKSINKLNNLILDLNIESKNINLFCGIVDSHFNSHVIPLIKKIDIDKNNLFVDLFQGNHSDLGVEFQKRFPNRVNEIICNNDDYIDKNELDYLMSEHKKLSDFNYIEDKNNIYIEQYSEKVSIEYKIHNINFQYACYYYEDDKCIEKRYYQKNNKFIFDKNNNRNIRFIFFIKDNYENKVMIKTDIIKGK